MINSIQSFILFLFCVSTTAAVVAQNYGHINFGDMLSSMPETQIADKELQDFNNTLVKEGEVMAEKFTREVEDFNKQVQDGMLNPQQQKEREQMLLLVEQKILTFEKESAKRVDEKRQEVLKPVIDRLNEVIEEVAKENGLELIFDTSVFNAVLAADESKDISALVRAKLGTF